MKKLYLFALILFLPVITFAQTSSVDNGYSEKIDNFVATYKLHKDSSVDVLETISYNFGTNQRHGIYRYIPYRFSDKQVRIDDIVVTDQGQVIDSNISYNNNQYNIRIGDPNKLVTGVHTYTLTYSLQGTFNYLGDRDELYWQVTGTGWKVPINNTRVTVDFSELNLTGKPVDSYCYAGSDSNPCASKSDTTETFIAENGVLTAGQGMTFAIGFPVESVERVVIKGPNIDIPMLILSIMISLVFLVFVIIYVAYINRFGRKTSIIPEYVPPKGATPLEIGVMNDSRLDGKDMSAEIIQLAIDGYLKITRLEINVIGFKIGDFELLKLKEMDIDPDHPQRKELFDLLFSFGNQIKVSELNRQMRLSPGSTQLRISKMNEVIFKKLESDGLLMPNSRLLKAVVFIAAFVSDIILFIFLVNGGSLLLLISIFAIAIIGLVSFIIIKPYTAEGIQMRNYIKGLKMYINAAEKDRINFHDAPEKTPAKFQELLPYAMIFGLEKKWAKQFEGITMENPGWYSDQTGAAFAPAIFTESLSSFSTSINSSFSSSSTGSSGGGSVGGGGGGGGGGSW